MKKQITSTLLGVVAVLALTAAAAHAQTARAIRVQVPFEFAAGGKQMPSGLYTVRRVRVDSESALVIRAEGGREAAIFLTNAGRGGAAVRASLTFRQHGDRYFLAEVSIPGTASVRELPKSGGERRTERELIEEARAGKDSKTVTVVGSVQ